MIWQLGSLSALHWRRWDDEWVVFDAGSGQTHLLDPVAAAALVTIEADAVGSAQLLDLMADALGLPVDPTLSAALQTGLNRLLAAGLVESAS